MTGRRRSTGLDDLLVATSRTFAPAIEQLPEPLRSDTTVAYLLFRAADTIEDSTQCPVHTKLRLLDECANLARRPTAERAASIVAQCRAAALTDHRGYAALLNSLPAVAESFRRLPLTRRRLLALQLARTISGMRGFLARNPDARGLQTLQELDQYCYCVAGIVGELLTAFFLLEYPRLLRSARRLLQAGRCFGRGLQLVNILRDSASDELEGRRFLPPGVGRGALVARAHGDLDRAAEYIALLQRAAVPRGVVAFCGIPWSLALGTLDLVENGGRAQKLSRVEVSWRIAAVVESARRGIHPGSRPIPKQPGALT